jgi:MarR-like DNA-binding transcriptional regulator SgrR of sgrS sRNA
MAQIPETDVWLFKISKKDGVYNCVNGLNITHRSGYDNQPTFSADGKYILYTRIDSSKQADIYQYDISKKTHINLTKSEVSEYSPTLMPQGNSFSCVVVEKDSSQRVWQYNLDGTFSKILFPEIDSIGYHTWLNEDSLLYYKLTDSHSLRVVNTKLQDNWLADKPTRAFKKMQTAHQFMYGLKQDSVIHYRIYNTNLRESQLFAVHKSTSEDFIWHPEFGLLKSEDSNILKYNEQTKQWTILFSFSHLGIQKITRFMFDTKNKQLVLVSNL